MQDHPNRPPRVLVVEDEPLICALAIDSLSDSGFLVEDAGSAREAMAKLCGDGDPFAAAIIDIGLPDRRGDTLAREVREAWPHLTIVIASGYDGVEIKRCFEHDPLVRVVTKPYNSDALQRALATMGVCPPLSPSAA